MVELSMAVHSVSGRNIVEVWDNSGNFVAAIYPDNDSNGVKIVSKYFDDSDPVPIERIPAAASLPVPALRIRFPRLPP